MRAQRQKEEYGKVKQPIPRLSSFLVVSSVLSFYGSLDDVIDLFQCLSSLTRRYIRGFHFKLIRQVIPKSFIDNGKLRKLPLVTAPVYGQPDVSFEWPKRISDFGILNHDQLKGIKIKQFKVSRFSDQIRHMVGLEIEIVNVKNRDKPKLIRFQAQPSDESNEEDLVTSSVRVTPEPSSQCEHIQCIGHSACTIQCSNKDNVSLFCQEAGCADGQFDEGRGLFRCSKFGSRYHCSCHKTNCRDQYCQGGVFCNCGHAHCLRYSKPRYNKEFPLNDNERSSFKAVKVYIANYDGIVADVSFNSAPCKQEIGQSSKKLDIQPFQIAENEQLVGVHGSIRNGFFQSLGLILYKPPI